MYATIEQANAYVEAYYSSTDLLREKWSALSEQDKQVALNRAEQKIDLLPLSGHPEHEGKAFPREPHKHESLEAAKIATIELAVQSLDGEQKDRLATQAQGVRSYRIGDLSETFAGAVSLKDFEMNLTISIVLPYLQRWLGGGYRICATHTRRYHGRL